MFQKLKAIARDANFHWKDFVIMIFIGFALMLLTNHVTDHLCK